MTTAPRSSQLLSSVAAPPPRTSAWLTDAAISKKDTQSQGPSKLGSSTTKSESGTPPSEPQAVSAPPPTLPLPHSVVSAPPPTLPLPQSATDPSRQTADSLKSASGKSGAALQFFHPSELKLGKVLPPQVADRRIGKSVGLTVRKSRASEIGPDPSSGDSGTKEPAIPLAVIPTTRTEPNQVTQTSFDVSGAAPAVLGQQSSKAEEAPSTVATDIRDPLVSSLPVYVAEADDSISRSPSDLPPHMQMEVLDRASYYRHYFNISDADKDVEQVCSEYLLGLAWVTQYVVKFSLNLPSIHVSTPTGITLRVSSPGLGFTRTSQRPWRRTWLISVDFHANWKPTMLLPRLNSSFPFFLRKVHPWYQHHFDHCFSARSQSTTQPNLHASLIRVDANGEKFFF